MKLGDIKGEFAPSRQVEDNGDQVAQFTTGGGGDSVHQGPGTCDPGPGVLHWDAICDVGTAIKQTSVADPLTNGGTDAYTEVEWTYLKGDVWTNGNATSFEDRLTGDFDSNDVVIGVKENIDWTAANGGPGSSYLTSKAASKTNAYVDEDVDGFMKLGDIKGEFASAREADGISDQVANPLDQMGFTNPSNDVVTNDLQTSWKGSWDKVSIRTPHGTYLESLRANPGGDGFMKLGDIRGEFAPSRKADGVSDQVAQFTNGGVHQQVPWTCPDYSNWDVICDIGTSIKQTSVADALTNYRPEGFSEVEIHFATENLDSRLINHDDILLGHGAVHPDMPMDTHPNDILLGFPGSGADALTNYRPEVFSEGVSSPAGYTDFVPAIALRSDNRFVIEPVNLFQGLDAGSMNYAEAVGMDSSTVDVINNVISSLQPANEFI